MNKPDNLPKPSFEQLTEIFVIGIIIIYVVLPQLGPIYNIFRFIADLISYTVIGVIGALISLFLVTLIGEMLKKMSKKIKQKLQKYDPRIAKNIKF